jgi:hypothetical protein
MFLPKHAVRQIRLSAHDAVEEGDSDTLRDDIIAAFSDDQVEEIERRIDSGDFSELVADILDEWAGDEVDELFELLEAHLSDAGVEVKYSDPEFEDEEAAEEDEPEEEEDDDVEYEVEEEEEEI